MLTVPKLVDRAAQPYIGIRRAVQLPFGPVVETTMPRLFQWIGQHGVEPVGPPLFRYNVIDMDKGLEIDFGVPTATLLTADDIVVADTLPAGRYATLTHHGHYDGLFAATKALLDWARERGLAFDMQVTPAGDRFAGRFEAYPNDPREIPDPADWETEIWIKLRD